MTDTTKPNGHRDRPSDGEAADRPWAHPKAQRRREARHRRRHGIAARVGQRVRLLPASTHETDIERHRRVNGADKGRHEAYLRGYGPGGPKRRKWDRLRKGGRVMSAERGWIADPPPQQEHHTPGWLGERGTGRSHFHPVKWYKMMGAPLPERESHGG
jgi:hypothetical protein